MKATEYALKQIGQSDGDRQLFEYSFHAGAPLALLTNGVVWRFYSTQSAGTYAERLVCTLDLGTDSLDDVAAGLERYLSYANAKSGKAADFAREDLNARLDQHNAREALPRAWAQLVEDEVDDRLASLLTAAASSLTEASPVRRDVAEFLRNLKPDSGRRPPSRTASRRKRTADTKAVQGPSAVADADTEGVGATVPRRAVGATPRRSVPSEARDAAVRYWLLGEERFARNAKEAYVAIFAALAERDPGFLTRVDPKLRGHKNRGVARARQELSSNESMVGSGVLIAGDWWVLTKMSNDGKTRSLRIACNVAGIPFGDAAGLKISLPNA